MRIESYNDSYMNAFLNTFNTCFPIDPLDIKNLGRRILWDQNFDPNKLLLALNGDEVIGFVYGVTRLYPDEVSGLEPENGYIVAIGVMPKARRKGTARALLSSIEQTFCDVGVKKSIVCAYATNYICPGIDVDNYPEGVDFFKSIGYISTGKSVSMDIDLHKYKYPKSEKKKELLSLGYRIKEFEANDTVATLAFMRREFPHWLPNVRGAMGEMLPGGLFIAYEPNGQVIGFVMRGMDGTEERFGPFGVAQSYQGKSIGSVLFHEMMLAMQKARIYHTYFLWTSGRNIDYYEHWGMKVCRKYEMLRKTL